jgi:uncharacterized repeat protein (TIGR03803 family)
MITPRARSHASSTLTCAPAISSALLLVILLCLPSPNPSAQAQTFTVLHKFAGRGKAEIPSAGVIRDSTGNLYGTSQQGGSFDRGTIFELDPHGNETALHSFWGGDGLGPSDLIRDRAGNFYGVTGHGGTPKDGSCHFGCGTVFKLDKAGKYTVLYAFSGGADGGEPQGPLVRDTNGTLYGVTDIGGDLSCGSPFAGCGVVFKLDRSGKETVLYTFTGGNDGGFPFGGITRDKAGNIYGAAAFGAFGAGVVFKLDPAGKEAVLYSFTGGTDGGGPIGPMKRDAKGNLYGVARWGGAYLNGGAVFKLNPTGRETVLYAFNGSNDGWGPNGGLVRDRRGNVYGTTQYGGSYVNCLDGCGTVFEVDTKGSETILHTFTGKSDGASPNGNLTIDQSGNLYGTTIVGGDLSCGPFRGEGCGVVFKISP